MTEQKTLADRLNQMLRTGLASAIGLMPMAAGQSEKPLAPAFEGSVAEAYTAENNYCPPNMFENGMKISGEEGIAELDTLLSNDVKRSVFGTSDLTTLDVDTISLNSTDDDAFLVSGDRSVGVRVSYGTNITKEDQGILIANADGDSFITRNVYNQTVESEDRTPLSAEVYDVRQALCELEARMVENGGSRSVIGGSDDSARDGGRLPLPTQRGPAYNVGSSLEGHAVSAEFSIDDVLASLPIGEVGSYDVSFEAGRAALARSNDGAYTIVAALADEGAQEIARVSVTTENGAYEFPITATARPAADIYSVKLGTEEDNRELNEAGVNLADNWNLATFSIGNENYEVEREFSNTREAAASESRRGYNEIVYDPESNVVLGTYDIGTARFSPREGLSPLERAIHNSNNAQVVGLDIAYNDSDAIRTGAYDPNTE